MNSYAYHSLQCVWNMNPIIGLIFLHGDTSLFCVQVNGLFLRRLPIDSSHILSHKFNNFYLIDLDVFVFQRKYNYSQDDTIFVQ